MVSATLSKMKASPCELDGFSYDMSRTDTSIARSSCASSKHLQTRRYLDTLQLYLLEVQRMLMALWKQANQRPEAFVDHSGILRDSRTGKALEDTGDGDDEEHDDQISTC